MVRKNRSSANKASFIKRIFKNFSLLSIVRIFSDLASFGTFVIISRVYGETLLGQYSIAIALTGFFACFSSFGLNGLSIRILNVNPDHKEIIIPNVIAAKIILSALSFFAIIVFLHYFDKFYPFAIVILLIGSFQIFYYFLDGIFSFFIATDEVFIVGLIDFFSRFLILISVFFVSYFDYSFNTAMAVFPIITFMAVVVSLLFIKSRLSNTFFSRINFTAILSYIKSSTPYFFSDFLQLLSTRMDVVLIGFFIGAAASGIYNASYRFIFLLMMLPRLLSLSLLPTSSRMFAFYRPQLNKVFYQTLSVVFILTIPGSFGLFLISEDLLNLIYGNQFQESVPILKALSPLFLFSSVRMVLGSFLVACDLQIYRLKLQAISTVIYLALNVVLLPLIGVLGAAFSCIISEILLAMGYFISIHTTLDSKSFISINAASFTSSLMFFIPLHYFCQLDMILTILSAILIYLISILLIPNSRNLILDLFGKLRTPKQI